MSNKTQQLLQVVKRAGERYPQVVATEHLKWAQEKVHAMALIRQSRDLQAAIPDTLVEAVAQAASMGLSLNPALGHCYLIPRRTKRGDPSAPIIAYASPSYKGLIHIAQESRMLRPGFPRSEVVYAADRFRYFGPAALPEHEPTLSPAERREDKAIGVYCIGVTHFGDAVAEYMDRDTVMRIRRMSEMPNGTMWSPDKLWTEGWRKAVTRRMLKTLIGHSAGEGRLQTAIEVLNTHEGVEEVREVEVPVREERAATVGREQAAALEDLRDKAGVKMQRIKDVYGINSLSDLPAEKYAECRVRLEQAAAIKQKQEQAGA